MTSISTSFIGFKLNVKTVHMNAASYNAGKYLICTKYGLFSPTFTLFSPYFSGIVLKFIFLSQIGPPFEGNLVPSHLRGRFPTQTSPFPVTDMAVISCISCHRSFAGDSNSL